MRARIINGTAISESIMIIEPYSTLNCNRVNREKMGFKNIRHRCCMFAVNKTLLLVFCYPLKITFSTCFTYIPGICSARYFFKIEGKPSPYYEVLGITPNKQ